MTLYAEFDDEFRPRPAFWRLGLVGLCQLVLSLWLVQSLASSADMAILRKARVEKMWIVDAVPWQSLKGDLTRADRGEVSDFAIRADREFDSFNDIAAAAFVLLAMIILFFVPGSEGLASRLFAITFAQICAAFGGTFGMRRCLSAACHEPQIIILAGLGVLAATTIMAGEWKANALMAGLFTTTPGRRLSTWGVRVLPGCIAIAAACWHVHNELGVNCAAALAALTLFANLVRSPRPSGERIDHVELVEAAATLSAVTVAMLLAALWTFGFGENGLVIRDTTTQRIPWPQLRAQLATIQDDSTPMRPRIDIHWSRRPKKKGR